MSGITIKQRRNMVEIEREAIKNLLDDQRKIRAAIKQCRLNIKMHREVLADERKYARIVREDNRRLRAQVRAQKQAERMHARIAKAEERLASLRLKANAPKQIRKNQRKASPVTVWTAEQVAALNS
jgi:hypothetical protein